MASKRVSTVKTRRIRLTREDICGVPVIGLKSTLVTGGFVKVVTKHDYQDGTKFELRTAWGDYEVDEIDDPVYRGGDVEIDYTAVDPDVYDLSAGTRTLVATADDDFAEVGDSIGFALGKTTVPGNYLLEAWTRPANGACAGGVPVWWYSAWRWVKAGKIGDETLELGTATFQLNGRAQPGVAALDNPYTEGLRSFLAGEGVMRYLTLVQPPALTDGLVELEALWGVQVVTEGGAGLTSFVLHFRGQSTAAIADDALAATVQADLEALSTIGAGNVIVTGDAGGPYTVDFTAGDLADTILPPMTATPTGGTGTVEVSHP